MGSQNSWLFGLYLPVLYVTFNSEYTFIFGFRKCWLSFSNTPIYMPKLTLYVMQQARSLHTVLVLNSGVGGRQCLLWRPHADWGVRRALLRTNEFMKLQENFVYLKSTCFSNHESKVCSLWRIWKIKENRNKKRTILPWGWWLASAWDLGDPANHGWAFRTECEGSTEGLSGHRA